MLFLSVFDFTTVDKVGFQESTFWSDESIFLIFHMSIARRIQPSRGLSFFFLSSQQSDFVGFQSFYNTLHHAIVSCHTV